VSHQSRAEPERPPADAPRAGYVRNWISFAAALAQVERVVGCDREDARAGLVAALEDGKIRSRFSDDGAAIDPARWHRVNVWLAGSDTPFLHGVHYGNDPPRAVELHRADLEKWLEEPQAADAALPPPATPAISTAEMQHFVSAYVKAESAPTKRTLWQRWTAAGHRGRRDDLFAEFNRQMGDAAPGRGRPRKSPK